MLMDKKKTNDKDITLNPKDLTFFKQNNHIENEKTSFAKHY